MEMTNKEMLTQKIVAAVTEDLDFYKDFISAQDAPSLQKVLQAHGFELTIEEIEESFSTGVEEILNYTQNGELSEDQLNDVSGGGFFRGTGRLIVSCGVAFGYGVLCGFCPAASAGAPYVAGGLTAWTAAGYMKKKK